MPIMTDLAKSTPVVEAAHISTLLRHMSATDERKSLRLDCQFESFPFVTTACLPAEMLQLSHRVQGCKCKIYRLHPHHSNPWYTVGVQHINIIWAKHNKHQSNEVGEFQCW